MWEFNKHVAEIYSQHVLTHIPNYETVIDKSIECCRYLCNVNDPILDFGSANGHTLKRLSVAGFKNLTGVDSSLDMLDVCDNSVAELIHSDSVPSKKFQAIISNWTLHFNENKIKILADMYSSLNTGGFLFLTEKTIQSEFVKHRYHEWKVSRGATWDEVKQKEQQLKGVMFLEKPEWYLQSMSDVGFKNISIVDASWGFVSYLAFKD